MKAKSYANKGEIIEAQKLYETILKNFSNNLRAQQGLAALKQYNVNKNTQSPPQEVINQLVNLYNQGQFAVVAEQAEVLTKQYPTAILIWNILGAVRSQIGMLDEAVEAYKTTIALKPDFAEAYNNMGVTLRNQGKFAESIDAHKKSISCKPDYAEAYYNMGISLEKLYKLDEAVEAYKKSISLKPNNPKAYFNIGVVLNAQNNVKEAVEAYNNVLLLKPDHAEAIINLSTIFYHKGMLDVAIKGFEKAILLVPDYAEAYNNMALALKEQGKSKEALEALKKAVSLQPNFAEAYNNMGNVLVDQNNLEKAIELFKKAILLHPNYVEAYNSMGLTLHYQDKSEEAIQVYKKAISLEPDYADAQKNLCYVLLRSGRLREGLDQYEWRWKTGNFLSKKRNFIQPLWDGKQSLSGKRILLWCEQGVGDTIMWSSKIPFLTSQSAHCILECQEKLVPLLKRSFPNVEVKPEDRSLDMNRDDFDYHLPMGSLYKHFIDQIIENDKPDAYLIPDPDRVNYWRDRLNSLGKGPYIGISWKSSNMSVERLPNYSSISEWSEILSIPNVTFINLQSKDFEDDLSKVREELGVTVHNFDDLDQWNNIDDVAALCTAIDIVICNHGTVPLISGGVGTATKLANWRQSSWNNILHNPVGPSIDIFERDTLEPWDKVFNLINEDIVKYKN
jgi:tetratricopeptide (TPR) repeat protein